MSGHSKWSTIKRQKEAKDNAALIYLEIDEDYEDHDDIEGIAFYWISESKMRNLKEMKIDFGNL